MLDQLRLIYAAWLFFIDSIFAFAVNSRLLSLLIKGSSLTAKVVNTGYFPGFAGNVNRCGETFTDR